MNNRPSFFSLYRTIILGLLALLATNHSGAMAWDDTRVGDWPGFRGPNNNGVADGSAALDSPEGVGLRVIWKKPLGSAYSAIAVGGGKVVTMFSDGTSDYVVALDESNGTERWRYNLGETYKGHDGSHDGPISTPLIADGKVFALSPRGEFVALSIGLGQLVWSTHLVDNHGARKPFYGFTTSPIFLNGTVVLELGAKNGAVAGFNPSTGEKLWAVGDDRVEYQTPIHYSIGGLDQILAAGNKKLLGVNPRSGDLLWEYEHGGSGPRGAWSLSAVPAGDGRLFLAHTDDQSTVVEFTSTGGDVKFKTVWEDRSIRNSYNVPVYHGGYVYAFSSRFLICVDASNGDVKWRSREPGDGFMIVVGDHLLIATKAGGLHIVKASPEGYEEVARLTSVFDDLSWCTPAFTRDRIFVRSLSEIARVDVGAFPTPLVVKFDVDPRLVGTPFGRFLRQARFDSDKKTIIDKFMKSQEFPIVENDWVHFIYRGKGNDLAVAADIIGARQERSMERITGTEFFFYSMQIEPDTRSNYLFIRDYEEILDPRNRRKTSTVQLTKDMEMNFSGGEMEMSWFAMPKWKAPSFLKEPSASRRGRLETKELVSKILKDKPAWGQPAGDAPAEPKPLAHTVEVYLPIGYDRSKERYPVAYIFDGTAAKKRGDIPVALDNLIGSSVQPIIAVLVHKTEPMFGGNPEPYEKMFAEELVPYIDKHYRTVSKPEARACIGSGPAGTTALRCAFSSGKVRKVAMQSAFLMDSMHGALESMIGTADENPMQIYMDWGKYDMRSPHENWDVGDGNRRFAEKLRKMGFKIAGGEVNDGCGWSSWRNRTDAIFGTLFPMGG